MGRASQGFGYIFGIILILIGLGLITINPFGLLIIIFGFISIYLGHRSRPTKEKRMLKMHAEEYLRERKSFSRYVKDEILERQQNRCAICNDKLFYPHFDHIDGNRSNNKLTNCQALCPNCHELKTRRDQKRKK